MTPARRDDARTEKKLRAWRLHPVNADAAMRWTRSEGGPTPDPSVIPGGRSPKSNRYQRTRSSGNTTSTRYVARCDAYAPRRGVVGSRVPFDVARDAVEDHLARRGRDLGV